MRIILKCIDLLPEVYEGGWWILYVSITIGVASVCYYGNARQYIERSTGVRLPVIYFEPVATPTPMAIPRRGNEKGGDHASN